MISIAKQQSIERIARAIVGKGIFFRMQEPNLVDIGLENEIISDNKIRQICKELGVNFNTSFKDVDRSIYWSRFVIQSDE